jgi:hypothetical protein
VRPTLRRCGPSAGGLGESRPHIAAWKPCRRSATSAPRGRRRKAPRGAHLESFELSPPERLVGRRRPEDQRGNPGAQASDNGSNHGLRWDASHVSRVRLAGVDVPLPRTLLIVWPISCIPHRVGAVVPPGLVTNFNESPIDERPTPLCPLRTLGRPFDDDSKEGRDCETPIVRPARLRGSDRTPRAGEIFDKVDGAVNALGGCGHSGGEVAGSGDTIRGEDPAQIRD